MQEQEYQSLQRRIETLTLKMAERDKVEAAAAVRRAVADASASYTFRDRQSPADFLTLVANAVSIDEDGVLSGSDGSTIEEVVQAEYERRPRWWGENNTRNSQPPPNQQAENEGFDFSGIGASSSPAELECFRLAIIRALQQQQER